MKYTLITGASSGLGREFAIQCARMGMHIVLVALPGGNTASLAEQLMLEYNVDVRFFEFDLTDADELEKRIDDILRQYPVNFLINNAGIGGTASITDTSLERIDKIIMLNVRSTALITRQLIPHMLRHERSYIMNISSMAAFTPIAYKTVYPASKAFISVFSLGLKEELAGTGISVSVVYPGPILTNSGTSRRIISQGLKGKMGLLPTPDIARKAIRMTLAGYPVIIPGLMNRISHFLMQLLPAGFKLRLVSREVKKEISYSI
ncbi:SDR family NAD(P)-dependent oxidoreductase [Chitinophaga barathri]|uniref:SDR family NAD(P)-dependent oxidoreductase n=1 Tax=Chitinophaga barathri TaxID=1647451 RepID=A0A3N4MFU6_9BACT|nr:SDR family NAD(P)-dependent oxidoreductase [Chitinophaga barathri]RPD42902.1 SDR family NAD(P)-dependent oxidoreductase [Chitinophaga barathri]